ncbi:MAG: glycosyltransferase family 4 protein [Candidatus Moranbacteria bacterium]|nr:glycosyltransferase family 4 protein [Candidatus Moranbacteria bacterium]
MFSSKKSLKILMIAPTPFFADRGTHIRILEEALALRRRGHEVTIATYHIGNDLPEETANGIDVRRIRRLLFWYKKLEAGPDWQKIILDLMLIRKTFFLARTWKPDIIHGHLHEGVLIGWIVKRALFWRNMRLVADFHGSLTKEMVSHEYLGGGLLRKVFERIERVIDNLGDAAVASSWTNAADISRIRRRGGVEVALDGARMHDRLDAEKRLLVREKHGIPADATVIVYTGAFIANKGIKALVGAMPSALARDGNLFFVVAGFPRNELEPLLEEQEIRSRVKIISPLPYFELGEILGMSDIAIDPKRDGTGQASGKMLQYMGAELPVVCFDTRNNREYLGDGGVFATDDTTEALADAIVALSARRDDWEKLGGDNGIRAHAFSWDKTGEKLEGIYEIVSRKDR